jgi:hypothetical protein
VPETRQPSSSLPAKHNGCNAGHFFAGRSLDMQ